MYFKNICFLLLASVGPYVIAEVQVLGSTQSKKPSWSYNGIAETDRDYKHHVPVQPQYLTQQSPQYTSEYPSEYIPYYPPQYTPPYPTQSRPQNPSPFKPPFTTQNKPQPSSKPPVQQQQQHHPIHHNQILNPSIKPIPTIPTAPLDYYNHRFPDGSYEFRYELPDETVRYERGYFIYFHHKKSLVVRGYYSYRLPANGYLTVFYTADHFGFRQDSAGITQNRPQLPRSLGERRILQDEEPVNNVSSINENKLP